jgi:hypothetical protein
VALGVWRWARGAACLPTVSDFFSVACGELRFIEHQATSTQGAGRGVQGARSKEKGARRKDYLRNPSLWHLRLELSGESVAQAFMSVAQAFMPGIEMAGGKNKKNLPLFSEGRFSLKQ